MTQIKEWQKALNVPQGEYNTWQKLSSQAQQSITVWALSHNKIDEEEYLNWAIDHYQIPRLKDSFFDEQSISQELWERTKKQNQWNKSMLPIYEWNKTFFIGCVEPPENITKSFVPILVSPTQLDLCWKKIQTFATQPSVTQVTKTQNASDQLEQSVITKTTKEPISTIVSFIKKTFFGQAGTAETDKVYEQVIKQAETLFTSVIIFSYYNKYFTPVEWSHSLEGASNPVPTKHPSIFRIVRKSKRPYHGFIVENQPHRQFFNQWGFTEMPQQITFTPIFNHQSKDKLIGGLMGISKAPLHPIKIQQVYKWSKPLEQILSQETKNQARAS